MSGLDNSTDSNVPANVNSKEQGAEELRKAAGEVDASATTRQWLEWKAMTDREIVEGDLLHKKILQEIEELKNAGPVPPATEEQRKDFAQVIEELKHILVNDTNNETHTEGS